MKSHKQTLLPLTTDSVARLEDFVGLGNAALVEYLKNIVSLKTDVNALYIQGDAASGKTYLLRAICAQAKSTSRDCVCFTANESIWLAQDVMLYNDDIIVCIDDIDQIEDDPKAQQFLLQWYEHLLPRAGQLIVAGTLSLQALKLQLADLKSRLSAGGTWTIQSLRDDEKLQVLQLIGRQRGLDLDKAVVKYLLSHYSRELSVQIRLLNRLDNASLAEQKKITIPFVKKFIENSV